MMNKAYSKQDISYFKELIDRRHALYDQAGCGIGRQSESLEKWITTVEQLTEKLRQARIMLCDALPYIRAFVDGQRSVDEASGLRQRISDLVSAAEGETKPEKERE